MKVRQEVQVRSPLANKWRKVIAVFDTDWPKDQISEEILEELGLGKNLGGEIFVRVKVLGEELSWPFSVGRGMEADLILGKEFIQTHGILLDPSAKRAKVKFAPGYPQAPVI
jgi:hypothetical protein